MQWGGGGGVGGWGNNKYPIFHKNTYTCTYAHCLTVCITVSRPTVMLLDRLVWTDANYNGTEQQMDVTKRCSTNYEKLLLVGGYTGRVIRLKEKDHTTECSC